MHSLVKLSRACAAAVLAAALILPGTGAVAQDKSIVVASTTSTQDSGLFGYLLPIVKEKTGIVVKVLAQGTGQALDTARRGDADVVFVHAKSAEEKFLAEGTPMWSLSTPNPRKKSSWRRAGASNAIR